MLLKDKNTIMSSYYKELMNIQPAKEICFEKISTTTSLLHFVKQLWGINVHHNEKYILWEDINSLSLCQAIILYMYEHLTHRDSIINKVSALLNALYSIKCELILWYIIACYDKIYQALYAMIYSGNGTLWYIKHTAILW